MPTYGYRGRNGEKILLFDTNGELSNEQFLWTYFLSSLVVLNIKDGDQNGEESFLAKLKGLKINL